LVPLTGFGYGSTGVFHHRSKGQALGIGLLLNAAHFIYGHYFHVDFSSGSMHLFI
jgi:hypothetical protein